jgi:hypothetical protein
MSRWPIVLLAAIAIMAGNAARAGNGSDTGSIRFRPVHVYVDPAGAPLAAYQIEVVVEGNGAIVGVEGGEHAAFGQPPHYDPAALAGKRIILAAFDTHASLPTQRTRVATLQMRESGSAEPTYRATLQIAGGPDGHPIDATVTLEPDEGDR